jgi:hypothetical protein
LEIDGVTSVLALLSGRLHMTLLMFFIIRELGLAVEEIVLWGKDIGVRPYFAARGGDLVQLVLLVYLVYLVSLGGLVQGTK